MNNLCVAHRGASGEAPENTIIAARIAMSYPFVQWMEIDVQLSKDGVPVVIHDDRVNRTTNGRGKVAELTAAELGRLDAGRWFGQSFAGERLPTLDQMLEATAGRCRLNIELKSLNGNYPLLEQKVIELLYKRQLQYDTVITSFDPDSLYKVKQISPELVTGLIIDSAPRQLLAELNRLECGFLSIGYAQVTPVRLQEWRQAGLKVMAWTVNDVSAIRRLARMDPDLMICTNYPDRYALAMS
ncbi:glycerophosphodiester phosphodiesterase [Paenibacillus sp. SYP-B4298]|uniref:glycerophosphodiester phosphodiesterase n=1 Tax=Paenibacillus sp. SYP-B4298 TaxID=2996034 RepID=UPI0022DE08F8|nr:glycerophosphodiester phosphodiesterase family protein [Paenibacillus sp. SYP-B4298]